MQASSSMCRCKIVVKPSIPKSFKCTLSRVQGTPKFSSLEKGAKFPGAIDEQVTRKVKGFVHLSEPKQKRARLAHKIVAKDMG